jgi:hypothetical protein
LLFLSWKPQDFWSSYPFVAVSFMRTSGYLKFLPVVYHFFHNRRLFEVYYQLFTISFTTTAGYLKFTTSCLPFLSRQPQVIWSFYQFFAISFMRTAGYLKLLPVLCHFFHENRRLFEISTRSLPFLHGNRRLFEVSTNCLPILSREPQVIWSFRNDQNQQLLSWSFS